jgi:hypothetical protein
VLNLSSGPLRGREWILNELQTWFDEGGQRATLVGPPGIGKSRVGRALVEANPGCVLIDFALARDPYQALHSVATAGPEGQLPRLLVIDALESAPPAFWRTYGLDQDFPDVPKLFIFRPGVHYEGLQRPGTQLFALDPLHPNHQEDLAEHLRSHGLEHLLGVVSTFQEAEFLIANPVQGHIQLDSYYLALWRESTRNFQGPTRILVEQVALLLADTPEGLPFEAISDFTGLPLVSVREAIDLLSPILTVTNTGVTLFSPGLASYIARHFSRDLGPVHGRIVSFFRETYPSWHEMHDPYGWRYLVLHCDRLARASRRQDFSVLHWLNEGSFSQLKLERTGMLPSVLEDLRLSLQASLETEDIPRVVSFGCRLARLRKHESVRTVHRLADAGNLALARENAFLVSGEGQKFLLWLLFATQTLEARDPISTAAVLKEALLFPTAPLEESEVQLAANLLAAMLSYPEITSELEELVLRALSMNDSPMAGCVAFITAGKSHLLKTATRVQLFDRAAASAARLSDETVRQPYEKEIASRLARQDATPGVAYPDRLSKAKDRDKELAKMVAEIRKGSSSVAAAAAALIPIEDEAWANAAFSQLVDLLHLHNDEEILRHGLSGLLQSLEDSSLKEIDARVLDTLSLTILSFDKPADRSRYLARFAVLLTVKGRPLEAQQRISLSAANAFSTADTAARAEALIYLAGQVASTGALGRARDLAFHALELRSRVDELDRESRQLVRLLSTSTAKNDSAEEIVRLGESLRFDNSPLEMEAKGRALVALAAGLARLGAESQARVYREKAIDTTRAIENVELRVHLLCDLAGALHQSGEKRQARKLAKEARALYDENEQGRGLQSATGLLRVSMVLENRAQTKKCFEQCLKYLQSHPLSTWLPMPALLDLLSLSRHLGRTEELLPYLEQARQSQQLSDEELLGLLRCELELGEHGKAENLLDRLASLTARCQGGIDLALACLQSAPERALQHLARIPLELARCEGIRRLALLNSAEIRPTEQFRVRHVLNRLTLMAVDHPDAMDSVLSRWIQSCSDRETILAVADKMGWTTGATGLFREALQTAHAAGGEVDPEGTEPSPESSGQPEPTHPEEALDVIKNDEGFQVVSLTKPRD